MKKLFTRLIALAILVVAGSSSGALAQSTANYAFTTGTSGRLTQDANGNTFSMTSGTTLVLGSNLDDNVSSVFNIGFAFNIMGNSFTQFSTTANGLMALGSSTASGYTLAGGSSATPYIGAFVGDQRTAAAADGGGVVSKVVGTAPNRALVVQWVTYGYFSGNASPDTFQVRLYETTGAIEYVYGSMPAGAAVYSSGYQAGFSVGGSTANSIASIKFRTNTFSSSTLDTTMAVVGGTVVNINSPIATARRVYTLTPPQSGPSAPTTLSFTAVTGSTTTVNWVDNSTNEVAFIVSRATDVNFTQNVVATRVASTTTAATGGAYNSIQSGLSAGTTYYYRVQAIIESVGTALTGNQATTSGLTYYWTGATGGAWATNSNWNTAADGTGSARTPATTDILIVDGAGTTPGSGGAMSISMDATASIGQLQVTSNTALTLTPTASRVITLTGGPGNEFSVGSGSSLIMNNSSFGVGFVFSGSGNTGAIDGTVTMGGSTSNTITTTGGTYTLVTVSSTGIVNIDQNASATLRLVGSIPTLVFASGSALNLSNITTIAPAVPLATWGATSNLNISGVTSSTTAMTNVGQAFGNITWNCSGQTGIHPLFGSSLSPVIQGDLTITNAGTGTVRLTAGTNGVAINGNVTVAAGTNTAQGALQGSSSTGQILIGGNLNVTGGSFSTGSSTGTVVVLGNTTIASGAVFYPSSGIAGTTAAIFNQRGSTFTNNGTITATAAASAGNLSFFSPTNAAQTFTGSGSVSGAISVISVQNTGGLSMSGLTNQVPVLRLNAFVGAITGASKLTFGTGAALATAIQFGNAAGGAALGVASLDAAPTFNLGTGLLTVIYGVETSARTTGVEIPSSRAVGAVSLGNTLGTTLSGGNLSALTFLFGTGSGKFITSSSNMLTVTGTTVGSISGQTNIAYVDGPLARALPASYATTADWIFPIGKGSAYKPFTLVNPTTNAGGRVTVRAEVFNASTGGTPTGLLGTLNSNRYWATSIDSGASNFTNTRIRLTDTAGVGSADAIGSSSTLTGNYNMVAGTSATVTANDITTNASFPLTTIDAFYVMGTRAAATLSNLAITPSGNQCTNVARTVTVTVTPGAGAITSVVLGYQVNGGAVQNVSMSNTSGNDWSGVIPTVTPSNATVTWTVTATDANTLSRSLTGTSYTDEPLNGVTATVTATPSTSICTGSNDTLTASLEKNGTATLGAGASTTASYQGIFYRLYGGLQTQFLVKASELTALGITAGNIKTLGIDIVSSNGTYPGFAISMADVGAMATMSVGQYSGGFTQVYSNASFTPTAGVNTFTFSSPFYWNGTSNIVIKFCYSNNDGGNTATNSIAKSDAPGFVCGAYYQADNVTPAAICGGTTTSTTSSRPKFIFGYNAAPLPTAYSWSNGSTVVGTTNPLITAVSATTTYTATITAASCTIAAMATITALPVPTTPTATNSTQCGAQVPTASVTSTSGFSSPTFRWYTVATGGTALAGETGSTLTATTVSTTTTYYVAERTAAGCESPRVAVTVTVNTPPTLTINSTNQTLCNGVIGTMAVTSTVGNYDTYNWSPATNLYTDPAATVPYTLGTNASTVYVKSTTAATTIYTLTASDVASACGNTIKDTIKYQPAYTVAASAARTSVCAGDTTLLTLNVGGASTTGYCATTFTGTTDVYFSGFTTTGGTSNISSSAASKSGGNNYVDLTSSQTVTQVPGSSVSFTATPAGASISGGVGMAIWVDWDRDGTFATTERVFNTTAYVFVAQTGTITVPANAAFGKTRMRVQMHYTSTNPTDPCISGTSSGEVWDYTFNVSPVITAYSWSNGASTVGTTSPYAATVSTTTTFTGTATIVGCPNSASVAVTARPLPTTPTANDNTHCGVQTPFASVTSTSGVGSPTFRWYLAATGGTAIAGQTGASLVNYPISTTTTFYVSEMGANGCESPRVAVTETVTTAPALAMTQTAITICGVGSIGTLSASAATVGNFPTFVWSPTTGLYSDASATTPYTAGSNVSTVYVKPATAGAVTYTLTASDANTGCVNVATATATTFTIYPSSITATQQNICGGSVDTLTFNIGNTTVPSGYCVPPANNTINYYTVDTFYTTGGSTNVSNIASGYSTNGYGDFTASQTVSQEPGGTVSFRGGNVGGYFMGWAIWVDWNQDGIYDTTERAFRTTATAASAQGSFTVPANALIGKTRMRIMANPGATLPNDPCVYTFGYGEVEEYTFLVGPTPSAYSWSDGATVVGTSNPLVQTVSATTTYMVTATGNGGCPYVVSTTITASPIPTAPTATNGAHCGNQTPLASVASTSGLSGSTFNWYTVATGGIAIAGQTGSTLSNYPVATTTTFYVSEVSTNGCEGPRVAVTETVSTATAVTLDNTTLNICAGTVGSASVTSTLSNYDSYTWSPTTNLFTDPTATTPYVGGNITTVYFGSATAGSTTYTVTATNNTTTCVNTATVAVTVQPAYAAAVSAARTTVCAGDTTLLRLLLTGAGGGTLPTGYCTPTTIPTGTHWISGVTTTGGSTNISNTSTFTTGGYAVNTSQAVTQNPNGSVGFTVTFGGGGTFGVGIWVDWDRNGVYDAGERMYNTTAYTGTSVTGSFTVPANAAVGSTQMRILMDYWTANPADPCVISATGPLGEVEDYTFNVGPSPNSIAWSNGVSTVGTTNPYTATVAATTTYTGTATLNGCTYSNNVTVTANPTPTAPTATNSTQCGAQTPTASVASTSGLSGSTFRWYTVATGGTAISGQTGSSLSSYSVSTTTTFYVSERSSAGCEGPRVSVIATVTAAPTLATTSGATSIKICNGGIGTLSVSAATVGNFSNYTWSPVTNLYTDAAATVPYTAGTNANTVYVMGTTAGTTTYTVTGTGAGCQNAATASAQILPVVAVTVSPAVICTSGTPTATLTTGSTFTTAGATIAWATSPDSTTFTTVGGATGVTYTPGTAITATTYYRATVTLSGNTCGVAARGVPVYTPTVTGNTPASRCGAGTLTLQATSSAGATLSWYAASTGGTALGTGTSFTTPVISATTTYYVSAGQSTCNSTRTAVVATVTTSPAIAVDRRKVVVCNNDTAVLAVSAATAVNYTTFNWSPATGLFVDAAATTPYVLGDNYSTVYVKNATAGQTVYTVTASDASNCSAIANDTAIVLPAVAVTVSPASGCLTTTPTATLTSGSTFTANGATIAWATSPDSVTFTPVSGATGVTYTPSAAITHDTFYQATVTNAGRVCGSAAAKVSINNPSITSTTPATRCGTGTVTLQATVTAGATLNWYTTQTGGTALTSGTSFTTPSLSATTTYYVGAASGPGVFSGLGATATPTATGLSVERGIAVSITQGGTLNTAQVYVGSAGAYSYVYRLLDNSNVQIGSSVTFSGTAPAAGFQTATLNWNLTAGQSYRFVMSAASNTYLGQTTGVNYATAPWNNFGQAGTITSGIESGLTVTSTAYYGGFFNMQYTAGCEGPRTAVTATVTTPAAIAVTSNKVTACNDVAQELSVSAGTVGSFTTYDWTPTTNLFTDAAATIPYTTGTNASTVYVKRATAGQIVYTVTGTDAFNCSNTATDTVVVLPAVAVTVSPIAVCGTGTPTATLTSGATFTAAGATIAWAESPDSVTFTPVSGATGVTYTPGSAIAASTYYQATVTSGLGTVCGSAAALTTVANPTVATTTGATRCGTGTVTLQATGSAGTTLNWYAASTGGTLLGTGTSFVTPSISSTTNYYVAASVISGNYTSSRTAPATLTGGTGTNQGLRFNATSDFTLNSVDVYNAATTSGTMTIQLQNNAGTAIQTSSAFTVPAGTGVLATTTPYRANLNWNIPAGTNYRLVMSTGTASLARETLGAFPSTTIGTVGTIVSGSTGGGNSTNYYDFYNWRVSTTCASTRTAVAATVGSAPAVAVTQSTQNICNGAIAQVSVSAATVGNYGTFTWTPTSTLYTDAAATTPYTGGNATTLYSKPTFVGNTVYTVTGSGGNPGCGNAATATVTQLPVVTVTVSPSRICSTGTPTATLTSGTAYTNAGATIAWAESPDSVTFTPVSGATGTTYTPAAPITASTFYQATVTLGGNVCGAGARQATIIPANVVTTQPTAQTVCAGQTLTLTVAANNATTYQWYRNGTAVTGATSATYTVATAAAGNAGNYTVAVSGTSPCAAVRSDTVAVVVNPAVAIIAQPTPRTICEGQTLTLSATASNAAGYQWYQDGNAITGATSATYTVNAAAVTDSGSYYVSVGGTAPCTSVSSNTVHVTVNPGQVITAQPVATTVCAGQMLTLSVTATNATSYQWYKGGSPISGATSATYSVATAAAANAGNYYVAIGGTAPCTSVNSSTVAVTVNPAVAITTQPTAQTVCAGSALNLSVVASNAAGYQWYQDGNAITGATSTTYTVATAAASDAGNYYVSVGGTAPCTSLSSNTVAVVVNAVPAITASATKTAICSGLADTLNVSSAGSNYSYSWNTTTPTNAAVAYINPTATRYYTVTATDGVTNCIIKDSVQVAVEQYPTVTFTPSSASIGCGGSPVNLTATINTTGTVTKAVWKPAGLVAGTPLVGLFTDAAGTVAYDSTSQAVTTSVYAKYSNDIAYALGITTALCPATTSSNSVELSINTATGNGLAAGSAAANMTYYTQSGSDTIQNANCQTIASIAPTGASPVSGLVMTTVYSSTPGSPAPTIAPVSNKPYVPRYYQITPENNASTATGTITLYATNDEFKSYNTAAHAHNDAIVFTDSADYRNLMYYLLPDNDSQSTVSARSANVLISKESGTSPSGLPGTFTPGVKKAIRPSLVAWNNTDSRWEVTFSTTGFSGFFIGGGGSGAGPLPVTFTNIAATAEKGKNRVDWNVGSENNVARYEVEKQTQNSGAFEKIGTMPAVGMASYTYYDASPSKGLNTYRVKAVDVDGTYSYSPSASVRISQSGGFELSLFPNPTTSKVTVEGAGSNSTEATVTVSELSGRLLIKQLVSTKTAEIDLSGLPSGTYMLQWSDGINKESVRVTKH